MLISKETMDQIHEIQFEMLKDLIRVMDKLNIKYYFVHGSLLGAIRDNEFIAEDDDIDIAIFRDDYNKLMLKGQSLINDAYFLQNSLTDDYPLSFAKMRKNNTAFIQPVLANIRCNKGIYIDIFPIDYDSDSLFFKIKNVMLNKRIFSALVTKRSAPIRAIIDTLFKIIYPSYNKALMKRELMYSKLPVGEYVSIYGGKKAEKHMPIQWFEKRIFVKFRGIEVACPVGFEAYLAQIYGIDYLNHNPAGLRIQDKKIDISADILDFNKSYLDYIEDK